MRNAALTLGIIAGIIGMIVGFFSFGYTELVEKHEEVGEIFGVVDRVGLVRFMSFAAPILAIAGGAMSRARALWGGIAMLISAAGMYYAFGFNFATMFPIGMAAVGGLLAVAAGRPDEPTSHF